MKLPEPINANVISVNELEQSLALIEFDIKRMTTFVEQNKMRDSIRTYEAASRIHKRKDLQIEFTRLLRKCEWQIVATNPPIPKTETGRGNKVSLNGDTLDRKELSKLRNVYTHITETQLDEIIERKSSNGDVTTFSALKQEAKINKVKAQEIRRQLISVDATNWQLHRRCIKDAGELFEPESIDHIITDPPYTTDDIPLFGHLVDFAEKVLVPGGSLVIEVGIFTLGTYLHEIHTKVKTLVERPPLVLKLKHPRSTRIAYHRRCHAAFKFILVYSKPPRESWSLYNQEIHEDGPAEEIDPLKIHKWRQSTALIKSIFEKIVKGENKLICDPFHGSGTCGEVARGLQHRYVGIDLHMDTERGMATYPEGS